MPAYLTAQEFRLKTLLPVEVLDDIEAHTAGWTDEQLRIASAAIDARLAKRYATPFSEPFPAVLGEWLAHIVTLRAWLKRGVNPSDEQFSEYKAQHDRVFAELVEAANSETGLFELPLRADTTTSGVARGFPLGYSEQSPYVGFDQQAETGRAEDAARRGTQR